MAGQNYHDVGEALRAQLASEVVCEAARVLQFRPIELGLCLALLARWRSSHCGDAAWQSTEGDAESRKQVFRRGIEGSVWMYRIYDFP